MTPFSAASPSPRARAAALDLGAFVTASPSSFHAAREAARRLAEAGFTELVETEAWTGEDGTPEEADEACGAAEVVLQVGDAKLLRMLPCRGTDGSMNG